uniref:Nucleic_acid_bd domain-containing protein n=1 Tax=Syphacia muris TaxID=451379 RepID=A0A0N5A9D6_9BILA
MNEQRSSLTGVCIQQQPSEQHALISEQQSFGKGSSDNKSQTVSAASQSVRYSGSAGTTVRSSNNSGMSGGVASQPLQLHRPLITNGVSYSSYNILKDDISRSNCVCLAPIASSSSSTVLSQEEKSYPTSQSLNNPLPSTSTADNLSVREKAAPKERQRCSFKLPASEAYRLRRIAEAQPITLKSIGIASVQIDNSGPISIIVSTSSVNFPETTYTTVLGSANSLTTVCSSHSSNTRYKRQLENTHKVENSSNNISGVESLPSTSCDVSSVSKRKSGEFDTPSVSAVLRGGVGISRVSSSSDSSNPNGQSAIATVNTSSRQQQPNNVNNSSPLLVNLLSFFNKNFVFRSASPGAGAGMNAQHSQVLSHRSTGSTNSQPVMTSGQSPPAAYSPYGGAAFMPRTPVASSTPNGPPSVQMRPPITPNEMQQQAPGSSHIHPDAQQGGVERSRQIVAGSAQSGAPSTQISQAYYSPMQYSQQPRQMLPHGYVLASDGHPPQPQQQRQPPVIYTQQSRQPPRPQYMVAQQQIVASGHSLPPQYHQAAMEQEQASSLQSVPPPTKKRKRPTKKQKEAELQAASAAQQQQQQQQYMIEQQQVGSRMPPTALGVDRSPMIAQAMQGGQQQSGMVYPGQQSRGYPPANLQSPSTASPAGHMQNPTTTHVYYQQQPQQQHMWSSQQQIMTGQRSGQMMQTQQMIYSGQVQQQWQPSNQQHQRVAYPQGESGSEISSTGGSVHTSPMTSRNTSVDYSGASQSSSAMSPLYHQQQQQQVHSIAPHMIYQQQSSQTPPSAVTYQQAQPQQMPPTPSQQRNDQQLQQPTSLSLQQHGYIQERSQHLQNQHKNSLADRNGDYGIQDLGVNIADCGDDYSDLDSIEPMPDVSTSYQGPSQQCHSQQSAAQMSRRGQQQQQQGGTAGTVPFASDSQQHCGSNQEYDTMAVPSTSQAECYSHPHHNPSSYSSQQQQQTAMQAMATYQITQQRQTQQQQFQQQRTQHRQQYPQYQQPEQMQQHLRQRQRAGNYPQISTTSQPSFLKQKSQSVSSNLQNPLTQQQHRNPPAKHPPPTSGSHVRQPSSVAQNVHRASVESSPLRQRPCEEMSQDEESNINSTKAEISTLKEGDKDPINSTIESVLMRTRTDQDSANLSQSSVTPRSSASRSRSSHIMHPSSADGFQTGHQVQQAQYGGTAEINQRSINGQTNANVRSSPMIQTVTSASAGLNRHPSSNTADVVEVTEKSGLYNDEKSARAEDLTSGSEQIVNSSGYPLQRHITNGHDVEHMKDYRYIQPPNGMSSQLLNIEERKTLTPGQHAPVSQRVTKVGGQRRSRRKPDLTQEASPQHDDEEEYYLSAPTAQVSRTPYTRLSIAGGKVVGSSNSPAQQTYGNVQNAQNNFNATVARQQKIMKSQVNSSFRF